MRGKRARRVAWALASAVVAALSWRSISIRSVVARFTSSMDASPALRRLSTALRFSCAKPLCSPITSLIRRAAITSIHRSNSARADSWIASPTWALAMSISALPMSPSSRALPPTRQPRSIPASHSLERPPASYLRLCTVARVVHSCDPTRSAAAPCPAAASARRASSTVGSWSSACRTSGVGSNSGAEPLTHAPAGSANVINAVDPAMAIHCFIPLPLPHSIRRPRSTHPFP